MHISGELFAKPVFLERRRCVTDSLTRIHYARGKKKTSICEKSKVGMKFGDVQVLSQYKESLTNGRNYFLKEFSKKMPWTHVIAATPPGFAAD